MEAVTRERPGLPVLYMSGYAENAIFHQGRLDEGIQLLQKPFRMVGIARAVREAMVSMAARAAATLLRARLRIGRLRSALRSATRRAFAAGIFRPFSSEKTRRLAPDRGPGRYLCGRVPLWFI